MLECGKASIETIMREIIRPKGKSRREEMTDDDISRLLKMVTRKVGQRKQVAESKVRQELELARAHARKTMDELNDPSSSSGIEP